MNSVRNDIRNVAINYADPASGQQVKINLIDTPGHADFGGEVERVLSMADGVFLLVDAAEGPMPQTRFVLKKAFQHELRPIVVINKIDRQDARADAVLNEVFDLFVELGADDETLDFPVIYASGRAGTASWKLEEPGKDIRPVFEAVLRQIPAPHGDPDKSLQIRISSIQYNDYVGRIGVGRIYNGKIRSGQQITVVKRDGSPVKSKVQQLQVFDGFGRKNAEEAAAGDIVALIGLDSVDIGDSICDFQNPQPLEATEIEPPTLTMMFSVNDSPFAGREGKYVTSRNLRERLMKELESNVALKVEETENKDAFRVSGRGLLHLGILIENMRREGYELSISKPQVIMRKGEDGQLMEPIEYLVVDVPEKNMGGVMELVGNRKGELVRMDNRAGLVHLEFTIPARGLIGLRTRLMTATSGLAIMHHNFHEYGPVKPALPGRGNGVMVSTETGKATAYALEGLQDRGVLFVAPMEPIYEGEIVAEHCRDNDLPVNAAREKKLTNIRSSTAEIKTVLKPPRRFELEAALEYIEDDELVDVTPKSVRLRKALLKESDRKKADRQRV